MHTLLEYTALIDWKDKNEYHLQAELDEETSMIEYSKIDQEYWKEYYQREKMLEDGTCPDCNAKIQDNGHYSGRFEVDGGYVQEYNCNCLK